MSKTQGDQKYLAILDELKALHVLKSADYGSDEDPLANLRGCEDVGIEAWRGVWLRAQDKVRRINRYFVTGKLANEGVEDAFLDLASYSALALRLFRETMQVSEVEECEACSKVQGADAELVKRATTTALPKTEYRPNDYGMLVPAPADTQALPGINFQVTGVLPKG